MSAAQKKKGNGSYRLRILASLKDQMASFDKSRYTIEEVMRMADMTRSQVVNLSKVGLVAPRWRTYSKAGPGRRPVYDGWSRPSAAAPVTGRTWFRARAPVRTASVATSTPRRARC